MYKWNTDKIKAYLQTLDCIDGVLNDGPGGDVDTDNLAAKVRGADEYILICGFSTDDAFMNIPYEQKGDIDVEYVEVTDQSGHGLQSDDFNVAQAYIEVRQHFVGGGATVVSHLKDYF